MNRELIKRHNERVKDGHTIYHLGDFKVSSDGPSAHELRQQLNGNHVFIQGNHDKNNGCNTPLKYAVIHSYGREVLLTHKPEDADRMMGILGITLSFVSHVHTAWKFLHGVNGDMVNVEVDQWDYRPVDVKQIFKAYKKWTMERHNAYTR